MTEEKDSDDQSKDNQYPCWSWGLVCDGKDLGEVGDEPATESYIILVMYEM